MTELKRYRTVVFDSARWDGFEFRDGDIVISTPPKCGTTWTQMLCAMLVFNSAEFYAPLAEISPWLDMQLYQREEVFARLAAQEHRRFIKTHTPLDGLPYDERVTYLCVGRDPRDVAVSWAHHMANLDLGRFLEVREAAVGNDDLAALAPPPPATAGTGPPSPADAIAGWIDEPEGNVGLNFLLRHLQTFWDRRDAPNVELFHYGDYSADLPGQLRRLAAVLRVTLDDARVVDLAPAATFAAMKGNAQMVSPNTDVQIWRDTASFFHRGSSGQWREVFGPDDLKRYEDRVTESVPADLAQWMHCGWLGEAPDWRTVAS